MAAARPAARPLPAAGSPAAGSMVGSGRAGAARKPRVPPAARPGPARLGSALRLLSPLARPASRPLLPPGRGGRAARPEVSASPRLPLARPRAPLCRPPFLPPPSSSPGPHLPALRVFLPQPRSRLGLALLDLCSGICPSGSAGPRLAGAPGVQLPRSAGRRDYPPRSLRPPGPAERTPGMRSPPGRSRGRPAVPPPARALLAVQLRAPRLRAPGGRTEPDLEAPGRGPGPRTPGSYLLGGPWGRGPGRPGEAALPEAGGVGGRAAAPAKL